MARALQTHSSEIDVTPSRCTTCGEAVSKTKRSCACSRGIETLLKEGSLALEICKRNPGHLFPVAMPDGKVRRVRCAQDGKTFQVLP
jgi:hypothetical protein